MIVDRTKEMVGQRDDESVATLCQNTGAILTPIAPALHNDSWVPALRSPDHMHSELRVTALFLDRQIDRSRSRSKNDME